MKTLKPCPFCGRNNIIITHETADAAVYCADCFGEIKIYRRGVIASDLEAKWSTRPIEDALRSELAAVKEQQDGTDCNTCQLQDEPACDEICTSKATLIAKIVEQRSSLSAVKEELEYVLRDWNELVRAIGAKTNGTAIGEAKQIVASLAAEREKVERLEAVAIDAVRLRSVWPNPGPDQREAVIYLAESLRAAGYEVIEALECSEEFMNENSSLHAEVDLQRLQEICETMDAARSKLIALMECGTHKNTIQRIHANHGATTKEEALARLGFTDSKRNVHSQLTAYNSLFSYGSVSCKIFPVPNSGGCPATNDEECRSAVAQWAEEQPCQK